MGLSIALAVGIVSIALFTILFSYNFVNNSVYDYVASRSEISKIEDSVAKTIIDIQYPSALSGNSLVSFSLAENGTEKLWNFDKFTILVTYDANIGGVSTPTTKSLATIVHWLSHKLDLAMHRLLGQTLMFQREVGPILQEAIMMEHCMMRSTNLLEMILIMQNPLA